MFRRLCMILIIFIISQAAGGCSAPLTKPPSGQSSEPHVKGAELIPDEEGKNPALLKIPAGEMPEGTLAVILNNPDEKDLDQIKMYETYSFDTSGEKQLLIPVYEDSLVEVVRVIYKDAAASAFSKGETLCSSDTKKDEYSLLVEAVRPEGMPQLAFRVTYKGKASEYLLSYNGKEGTPRLEYMIEGDRITQTS